MGLITRCPSCGTMFKVVADQLRISEGWVRCGHCAEIFDAAADLHDESLVEQQVPVAAHAHEDDDDTPSASGYPSSLHTEVPASQIDPGADPFEIEREARAMQEHPLDEPFELRRADPADAQPVGAYGYSRPVPLEPEPELHDLSFVKQARQREFWQTGAMRGVLAILLLALVALLAGQYAYDERDRLAAGSPALRPWLARMCDALRCQVGPPRLIDSVAIETSSFNKLRGDTYRLNVTLRNPGTLPVAMPALELTLTDSQDQAVLRRVLQPAEFAPNTNMIAPASDWATSVGIVVNAAAAGGRVSGYRVLAFYP